MDITTPELSSLILKIFLVVICLYFLTTRTIRYYKHDRGQTLFKLIVTFLIWGVILTITITPSLARKMSVTFGLGDNLNTLIFIGFVISFAVIFRLLRVIEHLESSISDIVSKLAVNHVIMVPQKESDLKKKNGS